MVPHPHVHGWHGKHGLVGGKQYGGRQIVADAGRHLGQQIGRRRADDDEVALAGKLDMADLTFVFQIEHVQIDLIFGHHAHGQRCDEFMRGFRHQRAYRDALPPEQAHQFQRFIGGDTTADDEEDRFLAHTLKPIHHMPAAPAAAAIKAVVT